MRSASLVRTMETTGPAERDQWRTDIVGETSSLSGILGSSCPTWRESSARPRKLTTDLDAVDARRRLHHAAIRLLSDTASYRPVVLAIDDLQWADRDTLLLLSELLTVSLRNVLVLGTHRAGEFDPGSAGLSSPSLRSIELAPLSREDVEELLAAVSGRVVELGDVAAEFHHRTGAIRCRFASCCTAPSAKARSSRLDRVTPQLGPARPRVARSHRYGRRVPRPLPRPARAARSVGVEFAVVLGRRVRPGRRHGSGRPAAGRGSAGALGVPRASSARGRRQWRQTDRQCDQSRRPLPLQP